MPFTPDERVRQLFGSATPPGNAAIIGVRTVSDFLSRLAGSTAGSDSSYLTILNALPHGVLVLSPEFRVLFANPAAASVLLAANPGKELPAINLAEDFQLFDPSATRILLHQELPFARAFRGETVPLQEYLIRRLHTAERRWMEIGAEPVSGPDGVVGAIVVTVRDVCDRKKRDLALEDAAKVNGIIYNESLAGIIRVTVDGRIVDCNDALVRMLGYSTKQDLLSLRAPRIYFDPSDRNRVLRLLSTSRRLSEHEICFRRQDGSRCWVLLNARMLDAPPGEVGGTIVSTVVDISQRKIQEEILRQSEQRFAAFMHHLPGIAFIKDLDGRYVYYNEAAWHLFHIRPEAIVGKTDEDIWSADHAARYRQNDAVVVSTRRPAEWVEPVLHADGPHSWLIYKFPIIEHERVTMVCGIGIDITERTILEEQLGQARKMEALGRLAGGVAHDFNNLLTVIAGYSQLAIESIGTVPEDRLITYMREILDSSRRASGLTGQLLAFSRRQAVQPKVLNLSDLLARMDRLLQRVIGEHVEIDVKCTSDDCLIHADPNQMEQAIMNLAVNARDAMPLGGQLLIRCGRLAHPIPQEKGEPLAILLTVSDNGIGMEEAVRSRIFDPFYTSKEAGKGTGLGLSTVYGVVSQCKGRIDVDSTVGEGTTFRLYFPEAAPATETPAVVRAAGSAAGSETVLLVEDEVSVRLLADTILRRLGYTVLVAESGASAIRRWDEAKGVVDILLTDVIMPQMSGGELAHKLRDRNPGLRVLFMSGYTDDMLASHGVLSGDTQLIQKPFTADALGRKLRAVLDS